MDGVVGAVDHDLKAFLDQGFGGLQRFRHVWEEVGRVAEHFQLAQRMAVEQFPRQAQGTYRILGGITAGGVGQDGESRRRNGIEQVGLAGVLADIHAAHGDSDDLGPRGVDGGARLGEILVLAGADQQAGTVGLAGEGQ
ncbi:hypothetical protein SDC9_166768 [bioreactor metagenome]|uniref:Uncharacterized protein n=1 Tax=bioreactor metagenome TaxID=1076179 RepID=A0A645G0K5_9ZZZZ